MKDKRDLLKTVEKYKGFWVVLNKSLTKVISADKSAKKAYDGAKKSGEAQPTLFKVPQKNLPYFGTELLNGEI